MALKHTISECPQVERLALLDKAFQKFEHTLEGNGQEGMIKKMVRFEEKIDQTNLNIERLQKSQEEVLGKLSQVLDYKKEQEAIVRDRGVRTVHLKWLIGVSITLLLGIGGFVINTKKENNKLKDANQTILNNANEDRSKDYIQR